jgi:hypothetical protein
MSVFVYYDVVYSLRTDVWNVTFLRISDLFTSNCPQINTTSKFVMANIH